MRKRKHGGGRRRRALGHTAPHRSCAACRRVAPADQLVRFWRAPDGAVVLDLARTAGSRGAWTCADAACVGRALERGGFARAFQAAVLGAPSTLVQAVARALADDPARAAVAERFASTLPRQDFSPGRLAHPRERA
ncbi:MAG: YlxR family protein [Deltaproteobacteria bacterium]|nr:YlxR family protein [Deltaproteobacteria bacterium]